MTLKAVSWTLKDDFLYLFESLRSGQMSPQLCIPNPSGTVKQIGRKERHPPSSTQNLEKNLKATPALFLFFSDFLVFADYYTSWQYCIIKYNWGLGGLGIV